MNTTRRCFFGMVAGMLGLYASIKVSPKPSTKSIVMTMEEFKAAGYPRLSGVRVEWVPEESFDLLEK